MVTLRRDSTPPALAVSVALNDLSRDFVSRCLALLVSLTVIDIDDPAASVRRTVPIVREPRRPSFFAVAESIVSFASSVHRAGHVTRSFATRFPDASSRNVAFGVGVTVGTGVGMTVGTAVGSGPAVAVGVGVGVGVTVGVGPGVTVSVMSPGAVV